MEGRRLLFWWFGLAFERLCHEMGILYIIKIKHIYVTNGNPYRATSCRNAHGLDIYWVA